MTQLVIGLGEIGTAIRAVLECDGMDIKNGVQTFETKGDHPLLAYDVLHICFPYSEDFKYIVKAYKEEFLTDLVVVHSTVPLDTCDWIGAVHSPVRGVHPELEAGVRTFVKYFGGQGAGKAAALFAEKGIKTSTVQSARETEAMKLWDTTGYGWNILLEKAIKKYCEKHNLDFKTVYHDANISYNQGYLELKKPQFLKYVLKDFPGPIGGHCVQENWELLEDPLTEISKQLHEDLTAE